jgi:cobalamin-dependent methionine synthase I
MNIFRSIKSKTGKTIALAVKVIFVQSLDAAQSVLANTEDQKNLASSTKAKHLKISYSGNPDLFAEFNGASEPIIADGIAIMYARGHENVSYYEGWRWRLG